MEIIPVSANAKEREMKYHFIPIQSIFGSWKNSMLPLHTPALYLTPQLHGKFHKIRGRLADSRQLTVHTSDTQRRAFFTLCQTVIEDHPRHKNRGKQIGE